MSQTSESVQALYEKYPYPPREPGETQDPHLDYILSFSDQKRTGPLSFLDAGCGTGSSVLGAAIIHKDIQVYGCDFNSQALAQVQTDVQELGLENVHLRQVDLLDFPLDWGPAEGFDVIFCTGVIHHTSDPLKILKNLAQRLAPQGVLQLMVYSEKGRSDLYRFARTVKKLTSKHHGDLESKVALARNLMSEVKGVGQTEGLQPPPLRGIMEDSDRVCVEEFVDRYLNPHDIPYTLDTLKEHIEESGLTLLRWFEQRKWDLEQLLPELFETGQVPADPWEQYEIIENLFDRLQYDLFLVGPEFKPNDKLLTWDCPLRINPQVHLIETSFRGFTMKYEAKLLFYPAEELTYSRGRILKAVSNKTTTLRELLADWGEEESEDWFMAALYLHYRDYIYRPV